MKKLLYFVTIVVMLVLMGCFLYTKQPFLIRLINDLSLCGFLTLLLIGLIPKSYDGIIFASDKGEKVRWELQLNYDPEELSNQRDVVFKIIHGSADES